MITILSANGQFRADLIETDEGVYVIFSKKMARADAEIWKQMHCETIADVVFHAACDLVHDIVNALRPEPVDLSTPAQKRLRVLSIVH
jgi:hypothetical protein